MKTSLPNPGFGAGFTLVELLVVATIIAVITSVVVTGQTSFNKSLILTNTAYDIALALRSAETYGLSNRATAGLMNVGYGLSFNRSTPASFTFFADSYPAPSTAPGCHQVADPAAPDARPGDCIYEAASGEKVTSYTLGNGIIISDFCALPSGAGKRWSCANRSGGSLNSNRISSLDIVFARPNAETFMSVDGAYALTSPMTTACLIVGSSAGGARYITILPSGGITTNARSCP